MPDNAMTPEGGRPILMDRSAIEKIIPHRDPFLMIDGVFFMNDSRIEGFRQVRAEEGYFRGHFPGNPVMPGVLIVEAMAQLMGVLVLSQPQHRGKLGYFAKIDEARFRDLVKPPCRLDLEVVKIREKSRFYTASGIARIGDRVAAEAEMMLVVAD